MSKRASPALIGAFVLAAIAIVAIAVVTIGSGRFFRPNVTFVLFFGGSVNGLEKGAPVKFRGVPIGVVAEILLALPEQKEQDEPKIPVIIEVDKARLRELGATRELDVGPGMMRKLATEAGLRAQLLQQSFITGQLFIGIDLKPDSPMVFVLGEKAPYPEIPTLPTKLELAQAKLEQILDRLGTINWDALGKEVTSTVDGLNRFVNSPELQANLVALRETLVEIKKAVGPLAQSTTGATNEMRAAMVRLQAAIDRLNALADPNSPLVQGITGAIGEVGEAARAVRRLADDLGRDPSVLLRGKSK